MSTSFDKPVGKVIEQANIKQTLTVELQDHLNNISMSQDRIECLLDAVYGRIFGNNPTTAETIGEPIADGTSLVSLNRQAERNGRQTDVPA